MCPDRDGAVAHGHVEHLARAIENVLALLLRLEDAGDADCLLERAEARRQAAVQQRLLEMQVRLDKARHRGPPARIDLLVGDGLDPRLERDDAAALDADVDERLVVHYAHLANDQIHVSFLLAIVLCQ